DVKSYGGRRYSSIIGNKSDNYTGKAVDVMINDSGENDSDLGDDIADLLIKNKDDLDIKYIIWEQKIWTPNRGDWKKMEDRGDETQNHFDHVHVSVNSEDGVWGEEGSKEKTTMTTARWALLASVLIGTLALSGCHGDKKDGEPDDTPSQAQQKPDPNNDPSKSAVPRTDGEYAPGAVEELD